jgi:hypothetical protein
MVLGRMLLPSMKSIGVGALDIRTRVRRLQDLAVSEESLTEEMVGLVRFLVQAETLFELSACGDVPYKAAFVADLATMLDTKESIVEKLMRANAREVRVCVTRPTYLLLTFRTPETLLSIGYALECDLSSGPRSWVLPRAPDQPVQCAGLRSSLGDDRAF